MPHDPKRGVFLSPNGQHALVACSRHGSKTWKHDAFCTSAANLAPEFHKDRLCEVCRGKLDVERDALTGRLKPAAKPKRKTRKR